MHRFIPTPLRSTIKKMLRFPKPYEFLIAHAIEKQTMQFRFADKSITIESGADTPLYETIAEIVNYDGYQLRDIPFSKWKAPTIVDIGANIGVSGLCFAQYPGSHVLCVEPVTRNCEQLEKNIRLNGATNIEIVQTAIGPRDGEMKFWAPMRESVVGELRNDDAVGEEIVTVRSMTLATFMKNHCPNGEIHLMKLDCEGGEYSIVDQIDSSTAPKIRCITMEVHDRNSNQNIASITKRLQSLGYKTQYKHDYFERRFLHHLLAVHRDAL
jgi:FkbM family methyltransferase